MKTSFAFALFMVSVALAASAQASPATIGNSPIQLCYERAVNNSRLKNVVVRNERFVEQPVVKRAESRADGVNVKIRVKYDPESYSVSEAVFYPENGNIDDAFGVFLDLESSETNANVPSGEYWISLIAAPVEPNMQQNPFIFVIKEHVNVSEDAILSFDTTEAVNRISFRPKAPNGEIVNLSLADTDGNIIEKGNVGVDYKMTTNVFGPNNTPIVWLSFLSGKGKDDNGNIVDGISKGDILINQVSDRFYAMQYVIMCSLEGEAIFTNLPTRINESITVTPNVDYKYISNNIISSTTIDQKISHVHQAGIIYGDNGILNGETYLISEELTSSNFYCGLVEEKNIADFIALANAANCEKLIVENGMPNYFGISAPPLMEGAETYPSYNYSDDIYYGYFNRVNKNNEVYSQAKFNDVYTRTVGQTTGVYGNSVPMTSFCPMMTYKNTPEGFAPNFSFSFIGMNGEVRRIDGEVARLEVKYGGETVCNSLKESAGWCWSWFADGAHRGAYDINVTNDNVMLGNIRGVNTTDIHFDLANGDNPLPPLLQWMQYRNSEGTVTPMLDKATGSKLLFSSGIFDFNVDEAWQMWFTCREEPVKVKVEYALHGADTFKELPVDVIADEFFTPGFGHQYEVALDAISEQSYLGWFDLRVSLSDNSGNTMTQLFEPAFNIAELAGLETIGSDAETVGLDGRNIIAPAGSLVYDMSGRLVDGRDLAPGVYIVAAPASMTKVVVR